MVIVKPLRLILFAGTFCSWVLANPTPKVSQIDPCTTLSQSSEEFLTYDAVLACYRNIPFVESVREQTVNNLMKALQFYVFRDVAKEGPAGIDLMQDLQDLLVANFTNDFDFQKSVQEVFIPLNDGHVGYQPGCYRTMSFIQAFPLISYVDSMGVQRVYILDHLMFRQGLYDKVREISGLSVEDYLGMEVTEIDGVPVIEALQQFADEALGRTKDAQQRFELLLANHASTSSGQWRSFYGYWASPGIVPDKESITYTVRSPYDYSTTVTVPWIASSQIRLNSFSSTPSYKKEYCDVESTSPYEMQFLNPSTLGILPETGPGQSEVENPTTPYSRFPDLLNNPLVGTGPLKFYRLNNNTGILVLSTFSLGEKLSSSDFDTHMERGLEKFKQLGIQKLILDFTNNPGGSICLGYKLVKYLFPEVPHSQLYYQSDLSRSPLSMELAKHNSIWKCSNYYDPHENALHQQLSCMLPGMTYNRGGEPSDFTHLMQYNCDYHVNRNIVRKPWFQAKNIAIVSNGRCASTCSSVSNFLQRVMKVRTFVTSPFPTGTNPPISTAPGGMVFSYENLLWQITEAGLSKREDAPRKFPQKADFYFTIMENYGWDSNLPDEYVQQPATDRVVLDANKFLSPIEVWTEVSEKMSYDKPQHGSKY
ncbi:hypothetical protein K493DRAFT_301092 [Basidiobolus meristosporus CBS 931.73]|uniref:Tail specific protease domain-containing protein n=1 Tax=Basidiobolus meristosporus CBS 931.73 TaxID=1314790 RepID=A0A1Y1YDS7_9FUNG|nr:hypothetical protein K493DRAFT_301092 [Basidiobolus meristosporus CBS 931.73]|eukprot:ORX96149.1 hypothetical protein K493DRAFT_301092 [Basidiobolus meristosporus CBS 931.73]